MIYMRENGSWKQEIRDVDAVSYGLLEASYDGSADEKAWLDQKIDQLQKGMDLENGIVMNLGAFCIQRTNNICLWQYIIWLWMVYRSDSS